MASFDLSSYVRLSLQRALLGNVTANIRAVTVELEGKKINLLFYFEGQINDEDQELASVVETEVIADFDESFAISSTIERLDPPEPIKNRNGLIVYMRRELILPM